MLLPAPMYQYPSALPCTASTVSRFSSMAGDCPRFGLAFCRPNSQNGVSAAQSDRAAPGGGRAVEAPSTRGKSVPDHESPGLCVDVEGAGGYFLHPTRRLQGAAEGEKMRRSD